MVAKTHGQTNTLVYRHWQNLTRRLRKHKEIDFDNLFKKTRVNNQMDPRWWESINFINDMGACPEGMSLFRFDDKRPWSRDNCQWALKGVSHRMCLRKKNVRMIMHTRYTKRNCEEEIHATMEEILRQTDEED